MPVRPRSVSSDGIRRYKYKKDTRQLKYHGKMALCVVYAGQAAAGVGVAVM